MNVTVRSFKCFRSLLLNRAAEMMVVKGIFNGWLSLKRVLEMIDIRKQLQTME